MRARKQFQVAQASLNAEQYHLAYVQFDKEREFFGRLSATQDAFMAEFYMLKCQHALQAVPLMRLLEQSKSWLRRMLDSGITLSQPEIQMATREVRDIVKLATSDQLVARAEYQLASAKRASLVINSKSLSDFAGVMEIDVNHFPKMVDRLQAGSGLAGAKCICQKKDTEIFFSGGCFTRRYR